MLHDLFINATIMITFITLGNQFFLKHRELDQYSSTHLKILFGLINGILGCVLMIYSVDVVPNVIVDFRNMPIILASIFGGYTASIGTSLIIGAFRILYFGVTPSSITAVVAAIIMGIGCPFITSKVKSVKKQWEYTVLFCTVVGSIALISLVKDSAPLTKLLASYWVGSIIVAGILYSYVNNIIVSNNLFKKYKEESAKDFLTGLNNVRQFDQTFNTIANRVIEKGEQLSFLFIDIDFFKKVNDTYGHTEGDLVLRELGGILMKVCRGVDLVSRNGGEEFSVMLMDYSPEQAMKIAERIRFTVEQYPFTLSCGRRINITISIGIATYPDTTKDFSKLMEEADGALYQAKQQGRNKVVFQEKILFQN